MLGHTQSSAEQHQHQQQADGSVPGSNIPSSSNTSVSPIKAASATNISYTNDMAGRADNTSSSSGADQSSETVRLPPMQLAPQAVNPPAASSQPSQSNLHARPLSSPNVARHTSGQAQSLSPSATHEMAAVALMGLQQQGPVRPQITKNPLTPEQIQALFHRIQTGPPNPEMEAHLRHVLQMPDFSFSDPTHMARLQEIMSRAVPSQTPRTLPPPVQPPQSTQPQPQPQPQPPSASASAMNLTSAPQSPPPTMPLAPQMQIQQQQQQQQQLGSSGGRSRAHKNTLSANGHRIGRPPRAAGTPTPPGIMGPPQSVMMANNGSSANPVAPMRSLSGPQNVMVAASSPVPPGMTPQAPAQQVLLNGHPAMVQQVPTSQIVNHPSQLDLLSTKPLATVDTELINMYAARMRLGLTNLMAIASTNIILGKRKRTQAAVSALDELDLSDEDSQPESDFDSHRRRGKRVPPPQPAPAVQAPTPVDPDAERKKIFDEVHLYLPQPGSRRAGTVPPGKVTQKATKHMYVSKEDMKDAAEAHEVLVPIRIEFEYEGFKVRDTVIWNLNERLMSPLKFAELFCEDLDIKPIPAYAPQIATNIQVQLSEYAAFYTDADLPVGGDARVKIQLDIQVDFARTLVADVGLGGEFVSIVAHSIRDQIHKYRVSQISDEGEGAEPLDTILRDDREVAEWEPVVHLLNEENLDKITKDRELKEAKKTRREVRIPNRPVVTARARRIAADAGFDIRMEDMDQDVVTRPGDDTSDFRCNHCGMTQVQYRRTGPDGPKTLCISCASYFYHDAVLPAHRKGIFSEKAIAQSIASREQWQ
ncbi:hypothetical protein SeMB42_g05122 [Synchytrium endobioticum]|uniref:GATA-type domain-containing protein n=1 Tax=Synchytrium endobioticum TaxID=286115 RepID=A0A507CTE9_9FUNG|nr:hypothetical protein SeMB42_g05122 [Synchytrium endobioticum]